MVHSVIKVLYVDEPDFEPYWQVVLGLMNTQYSADTKKDAVKKARKLAKNKYRPATLKIFNKNGGLSETTSYS